MAQVRPTIVKSAVERRNANQPSWPHYERHPESCMFTIRFIGIVTFVIAVGLAARGKQEDKK